VLRLITIPISHYCEKARWGLERAGLPYREEPHVQGIHRIAARRAGGGATVPVLVTPEGAIGESADILAWCDRHTSPAHQLFPGEPSEREEVESLCARFDDELGPKARRLDVRAHARRPAARAALQQRRDPPTQARRRCASAGR
jgi:glutathione S-transferase